MKKLVLLLACFRAQSSAKKQTKAILSRLSINEGMDRSLFDASKLSHGEQLVLSQGGLKENDEITSLPGQPKG
ncbi:hypothetical protein CASFOL_000462 [Castilleja foliolosa]|uniref:Uncharacterized protein n=1 Tax=Castilleja foliolosa TaxID=1961234 RepID=A0ABD3ES55_9LAMI